MPIENTISVFCEYKPELELTVASFSWDMVQPNKTYTISIGRALSITLDNHIPVRPSEINWRNNIGEIGSYEIIEDLFGTELADQMNSARESHISEPLGLTALKLVLSKEQRHNIAELQLNEASTPPKLRQACEGMLNTSR